MKDKIKTIVYTISAIVVLFKISSEIFNSPHHDENKSESSEIESKQDTSGLTIPQKNALESAKSYLQHSSFSRAGLISQLSSNYGDGYSVEDATAAVNTLKVDWNKEAVKSAKSYLKISGFSCKKLIEQLSSSGDKYTKSEAVYAATQEGVCPPNTKINTEEKDFSEENEILDKVLDIRLGRKENFESFVDNGGLNENNDLFHGFRINSMSVSYSKDNMIKSATIKIGENYSLNDIFSNMGKYCGINKWDRINDNYSENIHVGKGYGSFCFVLYEKTSDGASITYSPPNSDN